MPVTPAAARTVVRAANTAGKQVTVTLDAGGTLTGTARFREPGDPQSHVLVLFGSSNPLGRYDGTPMQPANIPSSVQIDLGAITTVTQASSNADTTLGTVQITPRLTGNYVTSGAQYELGPGTPYRTADPTWTYGMGTE